MSTQQTRGRIWVAIAAWGLAFGAAAPVWAEKPDWAGQGHGKHKKDREERHDGEDRRRNDGPSMAVQLGGGGLTISVGSYFGDNQRRAAQDYYAPQVRSGHCPPGLAKKNNGCLPPGQAKKWSVGQRLPSGTMTYPVPHELRVRLGTPPAGHEFVRMAGDILLIAVGTSMVVDAIEDLMR